MDRRLFFLLLPVVFLGHSWATRTTTTVSPPPIVCPYGQHWVDELKQCTASSKIITGIPGKGFKCPDGFIALNATIKTCVKVQKIRVSCREGEIYIKRNERCVAWLIENKVNDSIIASVNDKYLKK